LTLSTLSQKLSGTKLKEKAEKYCRPANCEKLIVPRVNAEIWDKLDNKTKHHDLRASTIQKAIVKAVNGNACQTEAQKFA
jgi:hypothetical protein